MLRRLDQFLLLGQGDAFRGTTVVQARSHPDLDKYDRCPIAHDEINLPETTTIISLKQNKVSASQICFRPLLSFGAVQSSGS